MDICFSSPVAEALVYPNRYCLSLFLTYSIPIDQRLPVYCTSVDTGNQQDWDALYSIYQDLKDSLLRDMSDELDRILTSLACSQDDIVLKR